MNSGDNKRPGVDAGWTLLSAAFSSEPRISLTDCKQLLLFLIVPATYRLVHGSRPE